MKNFDDCSGLVVPGGFSYGDVLGAGSGMSNTIMHNAKLKKIFKNFFENEDKFVLGVCNGCQFLSGLKDIIPGASNWPKFEKNLSNQYECRLVQIKIAESRSIFFKDMCIPKSAVLGNPKKGFKQFLKTLTGGRITIGALGLGTAQGAFKRALLYSQEREAFGKSINQFQDISFKLSDMATQIEAAKHLVYHAAWRKDKGMPVVREAAMAKLFSSEVAMKVTTEAIQVLGGYGYILSLIHI